MQRSGIREPSAAGESPDSADEAPKRRTKPPKDGGQVPAYALHPGYVHQRRLRITGIVQGVGFRPTVWHLAHELKLAGWVRNDAGGVEVLLEGDAVAIEAFTQRLPKELPPLAQVRDVAWNDAPATGEFSAFNIRESGAGQAATLIGPDTAVCLDCLAEMFDPADRRRRYAFINCTHCGPRYTLTRKLPYDRAQTSMAAFPLCPECEREYRDPANRRFHAEPTACSVCGPRLEWVEPLCSAGVPPASPASRDEGKAIRGYEAGGDACATGEGDPVAAALASLQSGRIVAIKGLGGFHLACDARNPDAVQRLRERKNREEKPFAVMVANLASIADWVEISPEEVELLQSPERPIVLLRKKPGADAAFPDIAPGLAWLGVMLPYTPLHWLIFHAAAGEPGGTVWMDAPQALALVMTSANPGGEPLVIGNDEALERLAGIADAVLLHDRDIVVRCDDSVVRCVGFTQFIRRARGYTPRAIRLPHSGPSTLALGGYLKNTICVTRGDEAFVSQHIGSLDNPATCAMLIEVTQHLLDILQVRPEAVAHDLHPDFFSTRHALELAERWGVPAIAVQHHHAHIAAVAAEYDVSGPILGLALDGVGLGSDGGAWGGELLRVDGANFTRLGHLSPIPLPGGDKAASQPWRMAAAALHLLGRGDEIAGRFPGQPLAASLAGLLAGQTGGLKPALPTTSSLGRWFDAAAGLLGAREVMAYEGQAAMLLEGLAEEATDVAGVIGPLAGGYVLHDDGQLDLLPVLAHLADEKNAALGAALFHATLAQGLADWLERAARRTGLTAVALGGGCFLNHLLSRELTRLLSARGCTVLSARQVPPNDGGLSLGQAWVAMQHIS
ncbi:MAG: carbamoyltransferase HypF [Pseudomonadota bacterium]|nr:carbamoyltransferase HypF [Pseudomonadota bacterium]